MSLARPAADPNKVALVLNLTPDPTKDPDLRTRPPVVEECPPVVDANGKIRALREALEGFGFSVRPGPGEPCRTVGDAQRLVDDVLEHPDQERTLLVHVLANARWSEPRSRHDTGLLILLDPAGHEPDQASESVDLWVDRLLQHRTGNSQSLLVLDCTEAGRMAELQDKRVDRNEPRRHWVLAACGAGRYAYDGRLTEALALVLQRALDGRLDLDASVEHVDLRLIFQEVEAELHRFVLADGFPQAIDPPQPDVRHRCTLFPLPRRGGTGTAPPAGVDPDVRRLLDRPVVGLAHFLDRVAPSWVDADGVPHPAFCGRDAVMKALRAWADGDGVPFQVVTGRPGSGKSAVLAALVCSALEGVVDDDLRAAVAGRDTPFSPVPGLAVVHARNQVLDVVTESLARQWHLHGAASRGIWTVEDVVRALQDRPDQPCLVLDALDEADDPESLARVLLERLVAERRPDRRPVCRLLLGVRDQARFATLLNHARHTAGGSGYHDLDSHDTACRDELRAALEQYLAVVLRPAPGPVPPGDGTGPALPEDVRNAFATALVEGLMALPASADRPARCGEFLLATLHVRTLLHLPAPPGTPDAARDMVKNLLELDMRGILEQDLRLKEEQPGHAWARPVARLLARAPGFGMDVATLTHALTGPKVHTALGMPVPPTAHDIDVALDDLRFFLRDDVDEHGTRLYRFFHQDPIDALAGSPLDPRAGGGA